MENIAVAIVKNSKGKVLIASRTGTEIEPDSSKIIWVFPGVKFEDKNEVAEVLAKAIRHKTGFRIEVGEVISDRKHPEIPGKHHYYYECKLDSLKVKPIRRIHETQHVKWVDSSELNEYFTTSLDPGVAKYLGVEDFPAKEE